jgi:PPK2 family polyphosphate:nucleotide phosphotransferase
MAYAIKIKGGEQTDLSGIDADADGGLEKEIGRQRFDDLGAELGELQELLYAARRHSVLIVLQGRDTSGKDGAIRSVFDCVNPSGVRVEAFDVPTADELAHDFLWRCHKATPARGMMAVFNRSHYEDVLVVRVHQLAPEERWRKRYDHINHWEKLLADEDTIIVKFFLHISKDEQEQRLLDREAEVEKAWKLAVGDWKEREHWDHYTAAYQDVLDRCSHDHAPWYVVPANRKWFRNLAIAETLVETLRPYRELWLAYLTEMGDEARQELKAYRAELSASASAPGTNGVRMK